MLRGTLSWGQRGHRPWGMKDLARSQLESKCNGEPQSIWDRLKKQIMLMLPSGLWVEVWRIQDRICWKTTALWAVEYSAHQQDLSIYTVFWFQTVDKKQFHTGLPEFVQKICESEQEEQSSWSVEWGRLQLK
jgi:hypothetical protein